MNNTLQIPFSNTKLVDLFTNLYDGIQPTSHGDGFSDEEIKVLQDQFYLAINEQPVSSQLLMLMIAHLVDAIHDLYGYGFANPDEMAVECGQITKAVVDAYSHTWPSIA